MFMISPGDDIENIEIKLLLERVFQRYGYDFRYYAPAFLKRRIRLFLSGERVRTLSALQEKLLSSASCMDRFLRVLSIHVSAMFRDPGFHLVFREKIIPLLRTYPFIRIWCAGCAFGEEVYSIAILLVEAGLYERTRLYATDISDAVLDQAKEGVYLLKRAQEYAQNYDKASGMRSLSDYYSTSGSYIFFNDNLKKNIIWSRHNLATDSMFNEFQVILCRNVMIYFDTSLQERVHKLLYESLITLGVLGLGQKESLQFSIWELCYKEFDKSEKWYRKVC